MDQETRVFTLLFILLKFQISNLTYIAFDQKVGRDNECAAEEARDHTESVIQAEGMPEEKVREKQRHWQNKGIYDLRKNNQYIHTCRFER
jgi:hypothetical protein